MDKFRLCNTSVIILTPPPLHTHIHSIVKLCRKGVSQTKREVFFKKMCFEIFLERGGRWRIADVCRKRVSHFSGLKVERSVSSRFKVSFGDCEVFHCWTEVFESAGRCEAVLKGTEKIILWHTTQSIVNTTKPKQSISTS